MKLFLDQGVPRRAGQLLRDAGIEALHAAEVGLSAASDSEIIAWCRRRGAIAVTLDADFHSLVALSGLTSPAVIRLRVEGLRGPQVADLVVEIATTHRAALDAGALVTVEPTRVRIRRLPIAKRTTRGSKKPTHRS